MPEEHERSLGAEATFAGAAGRGQASEVSLGNERTLGGRDATGFETVIEGIEVVDLESRYRIDGTLGQGGMGAVLLATDTRLGRKVAIKRILGEAAGNRMAVQRFLTEAKAIAALNHPNIVQIYDYGRAKDGPFLIMEYVDGGSLLDLCRENAVPRDEAIDLACQLCDGLAKAHDLGIIHRDIKPANVLLTKDGIPKLTDFGLAKETSGDHGQTMTGAVLGTPDFMPPEQRRDVSLVDHRSDLWSLAATIYQMATGRSPKIIRFDLLPFELTKVLGKALEDSKDSRYQSAKELREALKAAVRVETSVAISTASAPVLGEPHEGQCKACGAVTSDLTKKFCRNPTCGASLRVACLKCDALIPVWDGVCGECGGNQPALLEARRQTLADKQAKAEDLAAVFSFDEALDCATGMAAESRPEFATFADWARSFIYSTTNERDRLLAAAANALKEGYRHAAVGDYFAAIHAIESIPYALRCSEARELCASCTVRLEELNQLTEMVRKRVAANDLDGLLSTVDRILDLRGDLDEFTSLRGRLVERERLARQQDRLARHAVCRQQIAVLRAAKEQRIREAIDACTQAGLVAEASRCVFDTTMGPIIVVIQRSWSPSWACWFATAVKTGAFEAAAVRAINGPLPLECHAAAGDCAGEMAIVDGDSDSPELALQVVPDIPPPVFRQSSPAHHKMILERRTQFGMLVGIDSPMHEGTRPSVVFKSSGLEGEALIGWIDQSGSAAALKSLQDVGDQRLTLKGDVIGVVTAARLGSPPDCWNLVPLTQQGVDLAAESRWEESIAIFEAAVTVDPKSLRAWIGLGAALKKLARFEDGVAAMARALAANPKASVFLYNEACYHSLAGQAGQAVERLARAVATRPEWQASAKTDPDFIPIRRDKAFLAVVGDRQPAQRLQAELKRGLALAERGRLEEAVEVLTAFTEGHPHVEDAWVALGRCLKRLNRLSDAADAMRHGLEGSERNSRLMYNRACYSSLAGFGEEALRALTKAISLRAEYAAAAKKDKDFDAIRSDPRFGVIVSRQDAS